MGRRALRDNRARSAEIEGRPPPRVTCPGPTARLRGRPPLPQRARARVGVSSLGTFASGPSPCLPSFSALSPLPPARLGQTSHPAIWLNPSGFSIRVFKGWAEGKSGSAEDGCLWRPNLSTEPAPSRPALDSHSGGAPAALSQLWSRSWAPD